MEVTDKAAEKALEFDRIAEEVFAPIYPLIGRRLLELAGIDRGRCLDIGCGGGHLGLALADCFPGEIILLDSNPHAIACANRRIANRRIANGCIANGRIAGRGTGGRGITDRRPGGREDAGPGRIRTLVGDVHALPLAEGAVDLAVSRGAMWFWDKEKSLREIWRVLSPGGVAIIGGGYGNFNLKENIFREMSKRNGDSFWERQRRITEGASPEDYAPVLEGLGFGAHRVIHEESGDWLLFRKADKQER
ncbi:MAG: class I SAM-dependent methyltransferase [Spirochaetaceae bacterium]|nr:class I SAM-dependent methyltransferase [Spirochaetaceae bacterium]